MEIQTSLLGRPDCLDVGVTASGNPLLNSARILPDKTFKCPLVRAMLRPGEMVCYYPESLVVERLTGLSGSDKRDRSSDEDIFPRRNRLIMIDVVPIDRNPPCRFSIPLELLDLSWSQREKLAFHSGLPANFFQKIPVAD